jgi:hypothetical protein
MRALILLTMLIAGCGHNPTVIRDRVEQVSVPVIQKCAGERPAPIVPMNQQLTAEQWDALSPKQRAETAAAQGLARMSHADELNAATSAC